MFDRAVAAIRLLRERGFRVNVNATLFDGVEPDEVAAFLDYVTDELDVEGVTVSPGYAYERAPDQQHFLNRRKTKQLFRDIFRRGRGKRWRLNHSSLYLDFLAGNQDYRCTPWGNPTRNIFGWQRPCYLLGEGYAQDLPGADGDHRLGPLRHRQLREMRQLHGALRLRGDRGDRRDAAPAEGARVRAPADRDRGRDGARDPARAPAPGRVRVRDHRAGTRSPSYRNARSGAASAATRRSVARPRALSRPRRSSAGQVLRPAQQPAEQRRGARHAVRSERAVARPPGSRALTRVGDRPHHQERQPGALGRLGHGVALHVDRAGAAWLRAAPPWRAALASRRSLPASGPSQRRDPSRPSAAARRPRQAASVATGRPSGRITVSASTRSPARERGRQAAGETEAHEARGTFGDQPRRLGPRALGPRAAAADRDVEAGEAARLGAQADDHADRARAARCLATRPPC